MFGFLRRLLPGIRQDAPTSQPEPVVKQDLPEDLELNGATPSRWCLLFELLETRCEELCGSLSVFRQL